MYTAPPVEVVQKLRGSIVDCVTFAQFTIYLSFSTESSLTFGAPFRFGSLDEFDGVRVSDFPVTDSSLMSIVGSEIATIHCEADGTLNIQFSNGKMLVVYANDPQYEAYTLVANGIEYFA